MRDLRQIWKHQKRELQEVLQVLSQLAVLNKAVAVRAVIISLTFKGATNKLVKFLLQISSRNNILKLILERNKKS
jgi:predicted transposase YdaD